MKTPRHTESFPLTLLWLSSLAGWQDETIASVSNEGIMPLNRVVKSTAGSLSLVAGFSLSPHGVTPTPPSPVPHGDKQDAWINKPIGVETLSGVVNPTGLAKETTRWAVGKILPYTLYGQIQGNLPRNPVTGQVSFDVMSILNGDVTSRFQAEALQEYLQKRATGMIDFEILSEMILDTVHTVLDIRGVIPVVGELADSYFIRRRSLDAAIVISWGALATWAREGWTLWA